MLGATLYLAGKESDGRVIVCPMPCSMCERLIINAGINKIVTRDFNNGVYTVYVSDLVKNN